MPGMLYGQVLGASRIGTGVQRLDELLGGGLHRGESLLVCGPPFSGKRQLLDCAVRGAPKESAIIMLAAAGPPGPAAAERARIVDAYSRPSGQRPPERVVAIGAAHPMEDGITALEELLAEVKAPQCLVLVDSLSVLRLGVTREQFFGGFRRLVGAVREHGAAGLFALEPEAHAPEDLPVLSRLVGGVLRLAAEYEGHVLSLERADRPRTPWTEYTFKEDHFDVTGSFHATRIR